MGSLLSWISVCCPSILNSLCGPDPALDQPRSILSPSTEDEEMTRSRLPPAKNKSAEKGVLRNKTEIHIFSFPQNPRKNQGLLFCGSERDFLRRHILQRKPAIGAIFSRTSLRKNEDNAGRFGLPSRDATISTRVSVPGFHPTRQSELHLCALRLQLQGLTSTALQGLINSKNRHLNVEKLRQSQSIAFLLLSLVCLRAAASEIDITYVLQTTAPFLIPVIFICFLFSLSLLVQFFNTIQSNCQCLLIFYKNSFSTFVFCARSEESLCSGRKPHNIPTIRSSNPPTAPTAKTKKPTLPRSSAFI